MHYVRMDLTKIPQNSENQNYVAIQYGSVHTLAFDQKKYNIHNPRTTNF